MSNSQQILLMDLILPVFMSDNDQLTDDGFLLNLPNREAAHQGHYSAQHPVDLFLVLPESNHLLYSTRIGAQWEPPKCPATYD